MSDGVSWTCGECGETFSAGGAVGDLRVARLRREHKEEHRVAAMTPEERREHFEVEMIAQQRMAELMRPAKPGEAVEVGSTHPLVKRKRRWSR